MNELISICELSSAHAVTMTVVNLVPVPENVRSLLCAIAYGWSPTAMELARVESLRYGGLELSDLAPAVELRANHLMVTLSGYDVHRRVPCEIDGKIEGTLLSEARFCAETILHFGRTGGFSEAAGIHNSVTIEAAEWTVVQGDMPSIWVGRVEGDINVRHSGNLIVERVRSGEIRFGSSRHLCLIGAYRYYLVQSGSRSDVVWHMVIDTGEVGLPDPEAQHLDFLTLQFVLGRQLRMPTLHGLSQDRRTVASTVGCSTRSCLEPNAFPPVPIERNNDQWIDESWAAVFFERISATSRERPEVRETLGMALEMYLDSMRSHLDGDYMRLQIGLEAFAYWLLQHQPQDERIDVKDKKAWKAWVKANEDAIRHHAVEGREDALYQKVIAAYRLSSGKVVPGAFLTNGLALTPAMVAELKGRDTVVHQGLISPRGYEVERDVRRIALVRTMLVALIAKAAGYGGAINGWDLGPKGYPLEPKGWWDVTEDAREAGRRTFVAEEPIFT